MQQFSSKLLTALLLLASAHAGSAARVVAQDAGKKDAQEKITFVDHIEPIFRRKCFSCHNTDRKKGGLALTTLSQIQEGGSSGPVLKPGDTSESRLLALVEHREEPEMPPRGGKLPDADIALIARWIELGLPENQKSKVRVVDKPAVDVVVASDAAARPKGPIARPRGLALDPVTSATRTTAVTALATSPWAPIAALSSPRQILLYDSDTLDLLGVLPFPEGQAEVLRFSRNGALLLAGGGRGGHSGRVVLFDVASGRRLREIGSEVDTVFAADISPDNRLVALGGPSKMLRIYEVESGELLHSVKKHTEWILALDFSPDGVLLASADRNGGLHVWEALTAREYLPLKGHSEAVLDLAWRIDSNRLATVSEDDTVRLWELENGGTVKSWRAHSGGALSVDFSRDGRLLTCGRDRLAKLWDQNGKTLRTFKGSADLALETVFDHAAERVIVGDWLGVAAVYSVKDKGRLLGHLPQNPPRLDVRVAALTKQREGVLSQLEKLNELHGLGKGSAEKQAAELVAAQDRMARIVDELDSDQEQLAEGRRRVESASAELAKVLTQLGEAQSSLAETADIAAAQASIEALRKSSLESLEALRKELEMSAASSASLTSHLRTRQALGKRITDLQSEPKESPTPDPKVLEAVEKLERQRDTLEPEYRFWVAAREMTLRRAALDKKRRQELELRTETTDSGAEEDALRKLQAEVQDAEANWERATAAYEAALQSKTALPTKTAAPAS